MTAPAIHNFTIYQGTTMHEQRRLLSGVAPDQVPVNLVGYTGRCHIRARVTDAAPLAVMTSANGGFVLLDAEVGTFALALSAAATSALSFKTAVYDVEIIAPDGTVSRPLQGTVTLSPEVTR